ncbi:MAG: hypothetical protein NOU37_04890 [Candidatus Brocadiales bacterium]|nr:hypothetical protein [Candidatus Bathyanammoxibius amoris]
MRKLALVISIFLFIFSCDAENKVEVTQENIETFKTMLAESDVEGLIAAIRPSSSGNEFIKVIVTDDWYYAMPHERRQLVQSFYNLWQAINPTHNALILQVRDASNRKVGEASYIGSIWIAED